MKPSECIQIGIIQKENYVIFAPKVVGYVSIFCI